MSKVVIPQNGQRIVMGQPIPDNPIVPFIEGDGIGVDITPVMKKGIDAAVERPMEVKKRFIGWKFMLVRKRLVYMG